MQVVCFEEAHVFGAVDAAGILGPVACGVGGPLGDSADCADRHLQAVLIIGWNGEGKHGDGEPMGVEAVEGIVEGMLVEVVGVCELLGVESEESPSLGD